MKYTKNKYKKKTQKRNKKETSEKILVKNTSFNKQTLYFSIFLFIIAFILYSNTLKHDYALDDIIVTTENPFVKKGIDGIKDLVTHGYFYANTKRNDESYRPLSMVVIAIETEFFGLDPHAHHFFNVFYYALSCLLLYLMLSKMIKTNNNWLPFFVSLIFTVHPIHTEVVANIKSRDEIFQFLFIVSTVLLLFRYLENKKIHNIILSAVFYFLALISKEVAVTFIAVIPLSLYFFTSEKAKKIIVLTTPYIAIFILYMILRSTILDTLTIKKEIDPFQNALMASNGFGEFIATNMYIHLKYLILLVFPHPLSWDYSINQIPIINLFHIKSIISFIVFSILAFIAIKGIKNKNIFSYAILFYLITVSVTSNFVVQIASTMGERFIYTSSLGFAITFVFFGNYLYNKIKKMRNIINIVFVSILLLYSFKTFNRNKYWKNNETIFMEDLKNSPNSARVHMTAGNIFRKKALNEKNEILRANYFNQAKFHLNKSIEIYPNSRELYYYKGYFLYKFNLKDEALKTFQEGLKYDSLNKDLLNYTGIIYTEKKDFEKGKYYFEKVIENYPEFVYGLNNLAYIYTTENNDSVALNLYLKAVELNPKYESAYFNIGNIYFRRKNYQKAIHYYNITLKLNKKNKLATQNKQKAIRLQKSLIEK